MGKKIKVRELPAKIKLIKEIRTEESDLEEDVSGVPDDAVVEAGGGERVATILRSGQTIAPIADVPVGEVRKEKTNLGGNQLYDAARGNTAEERRTYASGYGGEGQRGGVARRQTRVLGAEGGTMEQGFAGQGIDEGGLRRVDVRRLQDMRTGREDPETKKYESIEKGGEMRVKRRKEMY
ncbi:hypothetical protein J4402_01800 [Candidatus Pacearchaeota archaeon]|nr:hypothetical protein [Candidatus Pacearchaeota archaeon]